jgi:hypothetical protein
LRAEEDRLDRQFGHERDLRELDHLRDFFDEAAAVFENSFQMTEAYGDAVVKGTQPDEAIMDLGRAASRTGRDMNVMQRKMGLRLPVGHPVNEAFDDTSDAFKAWRDELHDAVGGSQITHDQDTALAVVVIQKWRRFVDVARAELDRRAALKPQ